MFAGVRARRLLVLASSWASGGWQDLHTDAPVATVGHHIFRASYDEDIGSTLLFDRSKLKRVAASKGNESNGTYGFGVAVLCSLQVMLLPSWMLE